MKLERLRVRGLRSYVSEVEIDLARLGEEGLFAIFGPTGSGKSTILDGIFLAFFGRCPRGDAGDCVSAGAFELTVRLEIDASTDDAPRPLAIERRFRWAKKRDPAADASRPEVRGAPKHLPLRIEERREGAWSPVDTGGHKPEDYLRDQIVRISRSDFQQAVVLPQGHFDALLGAKPAERRTLVASLFRTEHLGQPLFDALRARENEVRDELGRLAEAEREALVTPEEIEAAEEQIATTRHAAHVSAAALTLAEDHARHVAAHGGAAHDMAAPDLAAAEAMLADRRRDRLRLSPMHRAAEATLIELDQARIAAVSTEALAAATARAERDAPADIPLALAAREAWARHDEARARGLRAEAAACAEAARLDAVASAERAAQAQARGVDLAQRTARPLELRARAALLEPRLRRIAQARLLVSANQLAELAAERHLDAVTRGAAALLQSLSADRYALVRAADGAFAVADSALGGLVRSPSTLSGGETFLVSLALALALSERIQLAGRTRFDFFFLDEGFGGLDAVTLETAISALERLRGPHRIIGMISHLAAIEERMPRKLRVKSGHHDGHATVIHEDGEPAWRPRKAPDAALNLAGNEKAALPGPA